MIDGITIAMGGRDWIVPPLNLKAIKTLGPEIKDIETSTSQFSLLPVIAKLVHAALLRNYPDVTPDEVDEMLDLNNSRAAMMAILAQADAAAGGADRLWGL